MKMLGMVLLTAVLSCGGSQPCPPAPPPILVSPAARAPTPATSDRLTGLSGFTGFTGFGVLRPYKCVQVTIDAPTTDGRGTMRARDGAGTPVELSYVVDGRGARVLAVHFPTDTGGGRARITCSSRLSLHDAIGFDGIPLHPTYAQCQRSLADPPKPHPPELALPSCRKAVSDGLSYVSGDQCLKGDRGYHAMRALDKSAREWLERLQFGASFFTGDDAGCRRWWLVAHDLFRGRIERAENIDGVPTRVAYAYWVDIDDAGALSIQLGGLAETKYGEGGWAGFAVTSGISTKRVVSPDEKDTLGVEGWFTSRQRCDAR